MSCRYVLSDAGFSRSKPESTLVVVVVAAVEVVAAASAVSVSFDDRVEGNSENLTKATNGTAKSAAPPKTKNDNPGRPIDTSVFHIHFSKKGAKMAPSCSRKASSPSPLP